MESTPFFFQQRHSSCSSTTAQPPAVLHRSEVRTTAEPLGSGGFSDVYAVTAIVLDDTISRRCTPVQQEQRRRLVEQQHVDGKHGLQAQYAIKQLRAELLQQSATAAKDFQQAACDLVMESQYLERLQEHPNVIRLCAVPVDGVDAWSSGDHDGYFLLLERLDCTLADRIRSWKQQSEPVPTQNEQLEYVSAIAKALRHLHQHRIVYRDLKPQNVGITSTGRVALFDFGLCRQIPHEKESMDGLYEMSGVGTRRYMAPEVLRNGRYNLQADVYSLSMVAWELLSGCRPYLRYGLEEHRQVVCFGHERPKLLPGWSDWLRGFFQWSWHADPSARWDMDMVVAKLEAHLQPAPPSPVSVATPALSIIRSKSLHMPVLDLDLLESMDRDEDDDDDATARSQPLLLYKDNAKRRCEVSMVTVAPPAELIVRAAS